MYVTFGNLDLGSYGKLRHFLPSANDHFSRETLERLDQRRMNMGERPLNSWTTRICVDPHQIPITMRLGVTRYFYPVISDV